MAEVIIIGVVLFGAIVLICLLAVIYGPEDGFEVARSTSTHTIIERGLRD